MLTRAAVVDHKGEQDWGILGQGEALEVSLMVILVMIFLHQRESSRQLAHVDGRHEI